MLALRLPPELEKRLEKLAKKTGRTKSYYARQAITEYIEDMEDVALAESRLRRNPEFIEFDEAMQQLGIDLDAEGPRKDAAE